MEIESVKSSDLAFSMESEGECTTDTGPKPTPKEKLPINEAVRSLMDLVLYRASD